MLTKQQTNSYLQRGFSRRDIGRITTLLTAGVTLPFYNEYAMAQDAQRRISQPNNNSVIGASTQRPNASGASASVDASFEKRIDGWINPAAFSQASQFSFGNIGRVISLRGPGQISFDVSLFKTFSLMEKLKVQFRAEALNVSNTPTFHGPNTTFTNPQFGIITSQANYPRLIQIGVRFYR